MKRIVNFMKQRPGLVKIIVILIYLSTCIATFALGAKMLLTSTVEEQAIIVQLFELEGGSHFIAFIVATMISFFFGLYVIKDMIELMEYFYTKWKNKRKGSVTA